MAKKEPKAEKQVPFLKDRAAQIAILVTLISVLVPLSTFIFEKWMGVPALEKQISDLQEELRDKKDEVQKIEAQLIPFKTVALEKYTGDENQRMTQLAKDIQHMEKDVQAARDYTDMAKLDFRGIDTSTGGLFIANPISIIMDGAWEKRGNGIVFKVTPEAESKYRDLINKEPRFPFSYCFLANTLKTRNDPSWKAYAQKGIEILKMTTLIAGHDDTHDTVLETMNKLLNESATTQTTQIIP